MVINHLRPSWDDPPSGGWMMGLKSRGVTSRVFEFWEGSWMGTWESWWIFLFFIDGIATKNDPVDSGVCEL